MLFQANFFKKKALAALLPLFVFVLIGVPIGGVSAQNSTEPVKVEVFERFDCPHCQAERTFLEELQTKRSDFVVTFYDIALSEESRELFDQFTALEGLSKVTPITLIGQEVITGFGSADTTGKQIEDAIDRQQGEASFSFAEVVAAGGTQELTSSTSGETCEDGTLCPPTTSKFFIPIPFVGAIDVSAFSLPMMAFLLGFVDGFNPCAMWVLLTFLIVLAQVGSRKKMWQIAGLFIVAEAIMYYLIMTVWFTAWDFVGLDQIITPIVGAIAIGGGIFFLYEFKKSDGTCKVVNIEQRSKISQKIRTLANSPMTLITALGVIGLALSVNVIEFACSIGIPQAFTKIIELNNLSLLATHGLIGLYILAYMIDDFIVFGIALYSFEKIGITTKYSRWANLVGGILMIVLGLILIFKRQWLVFG